MKHEWQPIETAPEHARVFVAGWEPRNGNVAGYWWWHEDVVFDGQPCDHPHALLWCAIDLPEFPEPPEGEG